MDNTKDQEECFEDFDKRYVLFTRTITGLMHCIQKIRTMAVEEFGLKGATMNCLYQLGRSEEGMTLSELSDLCGEDKAAISRSVQDMMKNDYVRFESPSGSHYRAKICLTETGSRVFRALEQTVQTVVEEGGHFMTPETRQIFYRCLTGICRNLETFIRETNL